MGSCINSLLGMVRMSVLSTWSVNIYIWWNFMFCELDSSIYKWFQLKFWESLLNSGNGGFLEKTRFREANTGQGFLPRWTSRSNKPHLGCGGLKTQKYLTGGFQNFPTVFKTVGEEIKMNRYYSEWSTEIIFNFHPLI